jgi:adenylate kinase family enzyme
MNEGFAFDGSRPRIVVVGTSCAGKTTLARRLGNCLGVAPVELDELYWGENWTAKPESEFRRLVAESTAGDCWVVEGNYAAVRDEFWPRASMVVWLNYGRFTLLRRAFFRTAGRVLARKRLWHGNQESFRRSFLSRESILVWIWTSYRRRREELQSLRSSNAYPNLVWVELRHPREARQWARDWDHGRHLAI